MQNRMFVNRHLGVSEIPLLLITIASKRACAKSAPMPRRTRTLERSTDVHKLWTTSVDGMISSFWEETMNYTSALGLALLSICSLAVSLAGDERNGRIAFVKGTDIYTVAPDGSQLRQLTNVGPEAFAERPSWEPCDEHIVYTVKL